MGRVRARAVVALLCTALLVTACGRDQPPVIGTETIAVGDRGAPLEVEGATLDGGTLDLADLRGRVVVLNAWASWCQPCREEIPSFVALSAAADPADVAVVGLDVTDEDDAARSFVDEFAMAYPSIVDADGALLRTVPGVPPSSLPSTVILDREGRIAARIIGGAAKADLVALVASVGSEAGVTTAPTSLE